MKRKIILLSLVLVFVCAAVGHASSKENTISHRVSGGNIYLSTETGAIVDADKTITKANIPYKIDGHVVKAIDYGAFWDCTELQYVKLPLGIKSIGAYAFSGCKEIKNVELPKGLTELGRGAFLNCFSLESVWVPKSLEEVGYFADSIDCAGVFSECSALKMVTFEDGITRVPDYLFCECPGLESISIPDTVTEVGRSSFSHCSSLKSIKLSEQIKMIGSAAFAECSALQSITLPSGITDIGAYAFSGCQAITSVDLPKNLTELGRGAFRDCSSLESVWVPKSLVDVGYFADSVDKAGVFSGCSVLKGVIFEDGIARIPDNIFRECPGFESISIPDSVTEIGRAAFLNCSSLKNIKLSEQIKTIGSAAFAECIALQSIAIPSGITSIGAFAFSGCYSIISVDLPKNLTELGRGAFRDCSSLESVWVPKSLVDVGYFADSVDKAGVFSGCSVLKGVIFEDGITRIPDNLFRDCPGFESVSIPDSVTEIGRAAFLNCSSLKNIKLSEQIKTIGSAAFAECIALQSIAIPSGITSIGAFAFSGCYSITSVDLPKNLTELGRGAFRDCSSLESVWVPKSLVDVGYFADSVDKAGVFSGCSVLKGVIFEDGITRIPDNLFRECPGLESIAIPSTVTEIGPYAFSDCPSLIEVVFQGPTPTFDETAFQNTNARLRFVSLQGDGRALQLEIVDAHTLAPLSGASVTVQDHAGQDVASVQLASNGQCTLYLPKGDYRIVASAGNGYKTRVAQWTGRSTSHMRIGLTQKELVSVVFNQQEMTLDEMKQAGIDPEDSENQHVFHYSITLAYNAELKLPLDLYTNRQGKVKLSSSLAAGNAAEWGQPLTLTVPATPTGGKAAVPQCVTVYPISEQFFLIIWGKDTWLKEMFHVQMLVLNQSQTDTLADCQCALTLPEGLSLADMKEEYQEQTVRLSPVEPLQSAVADWYVRGDREGEYSLTAQLSGQFMPIREPFAYRYVCEEPVRVLAGSALKLTLSFPAAAYQGQRYPVRLTLSNSSDKPLYNVTHTIEAVREVKLSAYNSSQRELTREELYFKTLDDSATISVPVLLPGEQVYVDMTVPIYFNSMLEDIAKAGDDLDYSTAIAEIFVPGVSLLPVQVAAKVLSFIHAQYIFQNATVTVLDGSTTEIPVEINVLPPDRSFFVRRAITNVGVQLGIELAVEKISKMVGFGGKVFKQLLDVEKESMIYIASDLFDATDVRVSTGKSGNATTAYTRNEVTIGEPVQYRLSMPAPYRFAQQATVTADNASFLIGTAGAATQPVPVASDKVASILIMPDEGTKVSVLGNTALIEGKGADVRMTMLHQGETGVQITLEGKTLAIDLVTARGLEIAADQGAPAADLNAVNQRVTITAQDGVFPVSKALVDKLLRNENASLVLESPSASLVMQWYSLLALRLQMADQDSVIFSLGVRDNALSLTCTDQQGAAQKILFAKDVFLLIPKSENAAEQEISPIYGVSEALQVPVIRLDSVEFANIHEMKRMN